MDQDPCPIHLPWGCSLSWPKQNGCNWVILPVDVWGRDKDLQMGSQEVKCVCVVGGGGWGTAVGGYCIQYTYFR